MKRTLLILSFLIFISLVVISSVILLPNWQKGSVPEIKQTSELGENNFPSLLPLIKQNPIEIEEIDTPTTIMYILETKISQPFSVVGNTVKAEVVMSGDKTETPFYVNIGSLENSVLFGEIIDNNSTWKSRKVSELLSALDPIKNFTIYIELPKDISHLEKTSPQYMFGEYQQQSYQVIKKIIEGEGSSLAQPQELPTNQIGFRP